MKTSMCDSVDYKYHVGQVGSLRCICSEDNQGLESEEV